MLMLYPEDKKKLRYQSYFNTLLKNQNLQILQRKNGYNRNGTIRENRVPKNCALVHKIQFSTVCGDQETTLDK